ncbi:MAG: flippase-like domain-containing protein [Candidatus Rokubacteria bacterium]|nr:flippase-like domain-containing protein [Candidatus Rokubacteria bacterium]
MRVVRGALLLAGTSILAVLVTQVGIAAIGAALARVAWWQLLLVCLPYALSTAVDTLGWRFTFTEARPPFFWLLAARVAGEAVNVVSALASVGGEAVKVWLLRPHVPYEASVPAVIIAKTTVTIAQALLLLLGIAVAWTVVGIDSQVLGAMIWLLAVEVVAVGGFVLSQVCGLLARSGRLLRWSGLIADPSSAERVDATLRTFYRRQWLPLVLSVGCHFAGWLIGVLEAAVILHVLQVPVSFATTTVIEALGSGVRFATFLVPASLGAYEGANAAAFGALGLGAGTGIAFSLLRRTRQAVWIGVGALVIVLARTGAARPREGRTALPQ